MKAAVFKGPGIPLSIEEIDKPEIANNEMLVRVANCGVCGTDIHASREGPFMAPPNTVFGHEFSGEVVEIGSELKDARRNHHPHKNDSAFYRNRNPSKLLFASAMRMSKHPLA